MPSDWVTRDPPALLSADQIENVRTRIATRLSIMIPKMAGLDRKKWWPISRQIYADVAKNGKPDRIDTFNGNYGLNRGLAASCLVLVVVALAHADWLIAGGLFIGACIYRIPRVPLWRALRERSIPAVSGSLKNHCCKDSHSTAARLYPLQAMAK
jgi:hypothetical protein